MLPRTFHAAVRQAKGRTLGAQLIAARDPGVVVSRDGAPIRWKTRFMEATAATKNDETKARFRTPESIGLGRTGSRKICDEEPAQSSHSRCRANAMGAGYAR